MQILKRVVPVSVALVLLVVGDGRAAPWGADAVNAALDQYEAGHSQAVRQMAAAYANGETASLPPMVERKPAARPFVEFSGGPELYAYRYWERSGGRNFMHLEGYFKGLFAQALFHPQTLDPLGLIDHYMIQGRMAWATLHYDGGVQDADGNFIAPLSMSGSQNIMTEWRALAARDLVWGNTPWSLYSGLGWRFLKDDSSKASGTYVSGGTQYDANGYKRVSQYIYWPTGVDVRLVNAPLWQMTLNGEVDLMLAGTQWSYTASALGTPVKNVQKKGFGLRAGVKFLRNVGRCALTFEPYFRYWKINHSEWSPTEVCAPGALWLGAIEPSNQTQELGVKMDMKF